MCMPTIKKKEREISIEKYIIDSFNRLTYMLPKCLRIIHLFSDLEFETAFGLDLDSPTPTLTPTPITGKGHCPGKFQLQSRTKNIFKVLKYVVSIFLVDPVYVS